MKYLVFSGCLFIGKYNIIEPPVLVLDQPETTKLVALYALSNRSTCEVEIHCKTISSMDRAQFRIMWTDCASLFLFVNVAGYHENQFNSNFPIRSISCPFKYYQSQLGAEKLS